MNCMIAGATGLVGGNLLSQLLEDPRMEQIICVGRKALDVHHPKIRNVETNFKDLNEQPLFPADVAFCCLGTTIKKAGSQEAFRMVDHDFVVAFAEYARKNGVKKFLIVSALGADAESKIFYNKIKGEAERDLAKLGFESLVIFHPSLLLGERSEKRMAESLMIQLYPFYRPLLLGPLAKYAPIEARLVARSMMKKSFEKTPAKMTIPNGQMLKSESPR